MGKNTFGRGRRGRRQRQRRPVRDRDAIVPALAMFTVGSKTTTCTASDVAGNSASTSAGYRVVYGFAGFEMPVRNGPLWNRMQTRRSILLVWRVHDANGAGVTSLTNVRIVRNAMACPNSRLVPMLPLASYGGPNPDLRNLGRGRYQRDFNVLAAHGTCAEIGIDLVDGVAHTARFVIE